MCSSDLVNPAHLMRGTQTFNIADMNAKGRARGGRTSRPGTANPNCKISPAVVADIRARRAAGETVTGIAADVGLSKAQVSRIANGLRWVS